MKKHIVLLLIVSFFMGGALLAREKMILKVKVQTANVRAEPSTTAEIIIRVPAQTLLESSDKAGVWYKVKVNDARGKLVTGYIHANVVEVISGGDKESEAEAEAAAEEEASPPPVSSRPSRKVQSTRQFSAGGFKLMGGLSMANMSLSGEIPDEIDKKARMGFLGGLGFEGGSGRIVFEADLLYIPGGTVFEAQVYGKTEKVTISGQAITVPLLLKLRLMPGMTPYLLFGGEVGYLLNYKVMVDYNGLSYEEEIPDEKVNHLYYGLVIGGGLELPAGGMNLFLEARYNLGLSNQAKSTDPDNSAKSTVFAILFGVKF